ncbi:MAG TPA: glycine cleavage system protein GcvH [Candidatus Acidoferrales bacterium]|nr:glycine cleavage system protein GcvH [Candidatus Acidoferrales bacterium]
MKLQDYDIPDDLLYTKEHEWAKEVGQSVRVGITDYAAKTLNDVVYVAPSRVNDKVVQFKQMGTVESIKAVSELYSPLSGTITKVNTELDSHPELVNKSPYAEGWLVEVKAVDFASDRKRLLDVKQYASHLTTLLKK